MAKKTLLHRFVARCRGNKLLSFVLKLTGRPLRRKKWVFIIGCYNSGTTLLEQLLATHPDASSLNDEGVMLTDMLSRPEDFGWKRMWHACENDIKLQEEDAHKRAITIKRHWSNFYDNSKPVLLEKSIVNTARIGFFDRYFEEAYFIHIVRNGYAVAEGIQRKAVIMENNPLYKLKDKYPIELCARQWKRTLEVVEGSKGQVKNFLEITYEDLTHDPDHVLNDVTEFLGISPFSFSFKQETFAVHEKNSSIRNMNNRSIEQIGNDELKIINNVAGDYLKKYNYFIQE